MLKAERSMIQHPRIVFMGTPEFAVASLAALYETGYNIVGVITTPDKPAGRNMKLQESAVKKYAIEKGLNILQPDKLKNPLFIEPLKKLQPDLQIVVAFRMLPEVVWNLPNMGTINVHGSLLPQYRGAAPINWAIINGEKETGVTTFKLKHEIDTGDILLQESIPISDTATAGDIHDKMKEVGAQLLLKTVSGLIDNNIKENPQPFISENQLKKAPKIFTDTCEIDWNNNCSSIYNLIRGLSPYPGAFTRIDNKILKIFSSEKQIVLHNEQAGKYFTDGKTYLKFACIDGFIYLKKIQLEGKKRMIIEDFLKGYRF